MAKFTARISVQFELAVEADSFIEAYPKAEQLADWFEIKYPGSKVNLLEVKWQD